MGVLIPVEILEGLLSLKVLELDDHVRIHILDSLHELVHKLLLLGRVDALLAQTEVERVLQVGLVVGAAVKYDGQGLLGMDTGGGGVQGELANLE